MAGSRKPNPTHITRYERESYAYPGKNNKPQRFSHYDHGIKVPAEYMDEIRRDGVVSVEETKAEEWGRRLDEHDQEDDPWNESYRARVEEMAGDTGLSWKATWTVGHVVWPGDEDRPCPDCPYGQGV
jgi:hypothetical protein